MFGTTVNKRRGDRIVTVRDKLWKKAGQEGIPLTAAFELLPVCNFTCKMCYVRKSMTEVQALGGLKDADWWLDKMQQAQELGMLFPLLTGGEPLLHPDFRKIYEGLINMGMQISVNSNGSLIDRDWARWFAKQPPVRINLTLYGGSEDTYEKLCGNGAAFEKVRNAVQYLKEAGVPVKFNCSVTPQNVQDLEQMIAFAKKVESPIEVATYMFPPVRRENGSMYGQNDRLSPEEAGKARAYADYLRAEPKWLLGQAARFRHFVSLDQLDFELMERKDMRMQCRAGHSSFWIDWQGNITNCGMFGSVEFPLKNRTVKDAWTELREHTHAMKYAPVCSGCPNLPLCHSCIAMVQNECGNTDGRPEYLCRMNASAAAYYQQYAETCRRELQRSETE